MANNHLHLLLDTYLKASKAPPRRLDIDNKSDIAVITADSASSVPQNEGFNLNEDFRKLFS
jgi:hypothetical protein